MACCLRDHFVHIGPTGQLLLSLLLTQGGQKNNPTFKITLAPGGNRP
jgi:carbonic anhydrase